MRHADLSRLADDFRDVFCLFDSRRNQLLELHECEVARGGLSPQFVQGEMESDMRAVDVTQRLTSDILTDCDNACERESFVLCTTSVKSVYADRSTVKPHM